MANKKRFSLIEQLSNGIDSAIGIFDPQKEFVRRTYRHANKLAFRGSYEGARHDRNREPWLPRAGSADEDLLWDLPTLRERSRDLDRNDPVAAGINSTLVSNVVSHGIHPQSLVDDVRLEIAEEKAEEIRTTLEEGWDDWSPWADTGGRMNISEMQQVAIRQVIVNGEVFAVREMVTDESFRPFHLTFNLVESDRVDTPSDKKSQKNIRRGVELGDRGQPLAYWVCKVHPGDYTYTGRGPEAKEYVRIPVRSPYGQLNIQHLYWIKRPGQTRGEPLLAPVLNKFKDLAEYMDAELMAAKLAACFGLIIKQNANPYSAAIKASSSTENSKRLETIFPGMIERIGPNEEITQVNPMRPGAQFDPFVDKILRFMGTGVNMPYELIMRDFSKSNFSSSRAAILEARKGFKCIQNWLSEKFNQPVYDLLVEEMFLRNKFDAPDFYENRKFYTKCKWLTPGWAYIEPEKEIAAASDAIDNNISTLADECAGRGRDWEDVLKQRAREHKKAKELGLPEKQEKSTTITVGRGGKPNQGDQNEEDQ